MMIALMLTVLPEPVAPAMSRCGMSTRSGMIGFPERSCPRQRGMVFFSGSNSLDRIMSLNLTRATLRFGISIPTVALPGRGAILMLTAFMARARSSERDIIFCTLTPGAG